MLIDINVRNGLSFIKKGDNPNASGFLVEVEKVRGEEMDEWRRDCPEAFAREYDPASGLRLNA